VKSGFAGAWGSRGNVKDLIEDVCLSLEREGGDAAEDEPDDEKDEPGTNCLKMTGWGGGHSPV